MKLLTKFEQRLFGGMIAIPLIGLALTFAKTAKHALDTALTIGFDFAGQHFWATMFAHPYVIGCMVPVLIFVCAVRAVRDELNTKVPKRRVN